MTFVTNKIDRAPARVGENAKRLQDRLDAVNWKRFIMYAISFWISFLVVLFSTIVVIRLALSIF
jgi:hypothetical protein